LSESFKARIKYAIVMVDKIAIARISKTIVQVAVIANKLYTYQNKERVGYKNAQLFFYVLFHLK
jgi:hypothetical protein